MTALIAIHQAEVTVKAVEWEINMSNLTDIVGKNRAKLARLGATNSADRIRMEFMRLSDEDILNFVISFSSDNFITLTEHVKQEAKKLVDSQPF